MTAILGAVVVTLAIIVVAWVSSKALAWLIRELERHIDG